MFRSVCGERTLRNFYCNGVEKFVYLQIGKKPAGSQDRRKKIINIINKSSIYEIQC